MVGSAEGFIRSPVSGAVFCGTDFDQRSCVRIFCGTDFDRRSKKGKNEEPAPGTRPLYINVYHGTRTHTHPYTHTYRTTTIWGVRNFRREHSSYSLYKHTHFSSLCKQNIQDFHKMKANLCLPHYTSKSFSLLKYTEIHFIFILKGTWPNNKFWTGFGEFLVWDQYKNNSDFQT